jgi:hypothetical protein
MKIIRETFYDEIEEYCYLISNNEQVYFIQTYSKWRGKELKMKWDTLQSNKDVVLFKRYTIQKFNKAFFVSYSSLTSLFSTFKQLCYHDFTDFFLHLNDDDSLEFDTIESKKYLDVIAQKSFGLNFLDEIELDVTKIPDNQGATAMSLHENDGCYILAIGTVNTVPLSSSNVEVYAFKSEYLKVFFDSTDTVEIGFCVLDLSHSEFIRKVKSYYQKNVFMNSFEVEKKLKGYLRKRKIQSVIRV